MIKIHKLFKYLLTLIVLIPVLFLSRDAFGVGTVTIKKDQITLVKEFKNVNKGHSHAQGGIITDKYYVFASFNPNKSANSIYVVDRKSSKSREIGVKGLGHMNTFLYDWGKDEAIIMDSNSKVAGCLVGLNGKLKNIDVKKGSGYDCASKRPFYPNTNNEKAKENWRPQGRGKWGKYVMQLWWRDSTPNRHDTKIYVYKDKKLVKIFYIPVSVIKKISKTPGEIEDVSFD